MAGQVDLLFILPNQVSVILWLGLQMAREFADYMKGVITLRTGKGKGSPYK